MRVCENMREQAFSWARQENIFTAFPNNFSYMEKKFVYGFLFVSRRTTTEMRRRKNGSCNKYEKSETPIGFNVLWFVPVAAASNNQISSVPNTKIIFTPAARRSIAKIKLSSLLWTERTLIKFSQTPHWESVLTLRYCFHYLKFPIFNVYWNWKPDSNG